MDSPQTPTFPPIPTTAFGFTKLLKDVEDLQRSKNEDEDQIEDEIEDEIEDFTPTQVPPTPVSQCTTFQVLVSYFSLPVRFSFLFETSSATQGRNIGFCSVVVVE